MDSAARISFFIVLSFALHILSLPFDLILPTELPEVGPVGVSYVSRPLESFLPVVEREKTTNRMVKTTIPSVQKTSATDVEQHKQKQVEKNHIEDYKPIVVEADSKQKSMLEEPTVVATAAFPSEKPMEPLEPIQADTVAIVDMKSQLSTEKAFESETVETALAVSNQPLVKTEMSTELHVEVNSSSLGSAVAKIETPSFNQEGGALPQGKVKNRYNQGFKSALARYDVNPPPRYPEVAKRRGWEGEVVFKALILKSGQVGHLNILESSGYRSLDNAAREALARWKFMPATSFGMSLDSQVEIPVTFSLKGQ